MHVNFLVPHTVNHVLSAMIVFPLLLANELYSDFKNTSKFANKT